MAIIDKDMMKDAKQSMSKKVLQEGYVYAIKNGVREMFPLHMILFKDGKTLGQYIYDMDLRIGELSKKIDEKVKEMEDFKNQAKEYQGL